MADIDLDTVMAKLGGAARPQAAPAGVGAGTVRYELRELLGRGAFGDVFEARDRRTGALVAIKRLKKTDPGWVFRFKREFRVVSDLSHPNIVRLYELFCERDQWYLTMELVRGRPFGDHISRAPEDLRSCFSQLALGVDALHRSGCLHRDIKPSNALVEPTGRVALLDFGLATERQSQRSTLVAGTPPYMAPELGMNGSPTEASDWYAFGVMLYQALSGRLPFDGSESAIFREKLRGPPPREKLHRPGNDPKLEELALELLSTSAADRPTGRQVLERLEVPGRHHRRRSAAETIEPPIAGRQQEIRLLAQAYESARRGAVLAAVHGEPGIGKSTLVRAFATSVPGAGSRFYSGCCRESESLPFKGLDGVIDALCTDMRALTNEQVAAVAPTGVGALLQMFPVLKRVGEFVRLSRRESDPQTPHTTRRIARAALRELLSHLSARDPVVLFVDDLQWADDDGVSMLLDLFAPPAPPLLVVIAYRRDACGKGGPLDQFLMSVANRPGITRVDVPVDALDRAGVEQLLAAVPERAIDPERAIRETGGHPYLLTRLLGVGDWDAGDATDLASILAAQIGRLGDRARQLLEIIALSSRALSQAAAFDVAGEPWSSIVVDELRREKLVQYADASPEGLIEPYHARVREAVLDAMSPDRRRELHFALASYLENRGRANPESLAHHYRLAGRPQLALKWSREAAVNARDALAFARAAELLADAVDLAEADGDKVAVLVELADAQVQAGQRAAAARTCALAAQLASVGGHDEVEAAMRTRAGHHYLLAGHITKGIGLISDALGAVGVTLPKDTPTAVATTITVGAELATRGLSFTRRREEELDAAAVRRLDLLLAVARALIMSDVRAAWATTRALLEAVELGEPVRVQRAMAYYVVSNCGRAPNHPLILECVPRSAELAEELDDDLGRAWACFANSMWHGNNSRFPTAIEVLRETRVRFLSCGQQHVREAGTAQVLYVGLLAGLGIDVKRAHQLHSRAFDDAVERDDRFVINWARCMFTHVHLARDDVETAKKNIALIRAEWPAANEEFFAAMTIVNDVTIAVYESPLRAWEPIEEARPVFESLYVSLMPATRSVLYRVRAVSALAALRAGEATRAETRERLSACREAIGDLEQVAVIANTVDGFLCAVDGDLDGYERQLRVAERLWRERDQYGLMLTARLRIHQCRGELDQAAEVAAEMRDFGIAEPDRFAAVYVGPSLADA